MAEKNKSIEDFVKFTCSTEAEARTYLENAGWNTEMALFMYFDERDERMDASTDRSCANTAASGGEDTPDSDNDEPTEAEAPEPFSFAATPERSSTGRPGPLRVNRSNIRTFSSLRSNNDDDDDEEQLYYAGGSQNSGQQIMGNDRRGDVAGEVFKHLKQMVSVGDIELAGPSRQSGRATKFSGPGYRLGQTPDDTKVVGGTPSQRSEERPEIHLRLWRNGFTVGDEPLRPYSNPENREAIDMLLRGEVPASLTPDSKDGKVNVQVEDLRHENYSGPATRGRFFTGQGHVLGNVVPNVVTNVPEAAAATTEKAPSAEPAPVSPLQVNENEPITTVIIRLPNGARSQVRLNITHTVEELRAHLTTVHRELSGHIFVFMVNFPPKEVTDEKMSVKEAGLMNSSVYLREKK